jgi:hypothetical protein
MSVVMQTGFMRLGGQGLQACAFHLAPPPTVPGRCIVIGFAGSQGRLANPDATSCGMTHTK